MNIDLDRAIRKVPDFPKKGILYYDITGILNDSTAFRASIDELAKRAGSYRFDSIAAIEARGFVFGAPLAERLGVPLILVRKMGKLPNEVHTKSFALEYGEDVICIQKLDVHPGRKILLVDDLIATGGTLKAAASIFEEHGAVVTGILGVIGLPFLNYGEVLKAYPTEVLITYDSE
ncbi:MAG: adenine phosphoribosyltransferase [Spirochaetales bacterium]|nr:adenine phosphoribosyltransferase [Spirochaetales bacterium]